jgi:UDP-N-acetylmuramoyl-tripeptide--D-alanyl-D-alanine ligase
MFELEGEADREHKAIGRLIREKGFKKVYLCGTLFKAALREIPEAKYFVEKKDLITELKEFPITNATILVKASRGIGLETVIDYL